VKACGGERWNRLGVQFYQKGYIFPVVGRPARGR
jgi:hypothetical protein